VKDQRYPDGVTYISFILAPRGHKKLNRYSPLKQRWKQAKIFSLKTQKSDRPTFLLIDF